MTTHRTAEDAQYDPQPGDTWTDATSGDVWTVVGWSENGRYLRIQTASGDDFFMSVRVWADADYGVYAPVGGDL